MRLLAALLLLAAGGAHANTATVFPPLDCAPGQLMVLAWANGQGSTRCLSGQEVLRLALPNCGDGDNVVKSGDEFACVGQPRACGTLPSGASCTNTTYVAGESSLCNVPDQKVYSMIWKTVATYRCDDGQLKLLGLFSGEGACSNYHPGETLTVNECP